MSDVQPLPAWSLETDLSYLIRYTVRASTYLEAVAAAVSMLRTGVRLVGVHDATAIAGHFWDVTLKVAEEA